MSSQEDFVRNYAAKRAAQMERAKALREQREARPASTGNDAVASLPTQQQQQQQQQPQPPHRQTRPIDYPPPVSVSQQPPSSDTASKPPPRQTAQPPSLSAPGVVMVSEADFSRAASLGIITPEQARQLWAAVVAPDNAAAITRGAIPSNPQKNPSGVGDRHAYDAKSYAPQPSVSDEAAPRMRPTALQTPPQRTKSQIRATATNGAALPEWNADFADSPSDGGFGPPPPLPGAASRRPQQHQPAPKPKMANTPSVADIDSMPVGRRAPSRDAFADAYPPEQSEALPRASGSSVLAPGAANRAAAGRRAAPGAAPKMPVMAPPAAAPDDELAEFLRQKEEAKARLAQELAEASTEEEMIECEHCERRFRVSIIERHEKACKKLKQRKVFDTKKQRLAIEGAEEVLRSALEPPRKSHKQPPPPPRSYPATSAALGAAPADKIPKWKRDHQELQAAMRMNRALNSGNEAAVKAVAASMPATQDDRVPCPYCNRRFAEQVAERHIPKCKTTLNRPKPTSTQRLH